MYAKVVKPIHVVNTACKAHNDDTHIIHEWKVYAILTGVKSSMQNVSRFQCLVFETAVTIGCDSPVYQTF